MQPAGLSPQEYARYARHLSLPEVGVEGQTRLKASSVLLVGAGGLGSPLGMYLAAAGVGRLGLVDFDKVDASNLQRQVIHGSKDVGRSKTVSAAETLADINPHVQVDCYETAFTSSNALQIADPYQLIIDGTDNFPTRYLVNDVCVIQRKPNCYGSIFRFEGQASVFSFDGGPCYRCLYPQPPPPGAVPSCAEGGVLGVLPGVIGMIQAIEAIKILLGIGDTLSGRLLLFDALDMRFREMRVKRDPACPVCGDNPSITQLIDYQHFCGVPSAVHGAGQSEPQSPWDLQPQDLRHRIDSAAKFTLLDVRQPHEYEICNLQGTLIPLGELPQRHGELPRDAEIIVHCKMGGRSAKAVQWLRDQGFENVFNLRGGINAWSKEIDPEVPTY
jgi:molybdopterin/thiamine biosynthesis adenylyltransferase/rhodanese-related sulfurtransferase